MDGGGEVAVKNPPVDVILINHLCNTLMFERISTHGVFPGLDAALDVSDDVLVFEEAAVVVVVINIGRVFPGSEAALEIAFCVVILIGAVIVVVINCVGVFPGLFATLQVASDEEVAII